MRVKRILVLLGILLALALFLWAIRYINREVEIANFTTTITGRSQDQIDNLNIALAKIDGKILRTGEVFSFNEVVGERLCKWGYKGAPTIYQGEIVNTPGGGLCQLTSTIYNVALLSDMEIIERKPHLWVINSVGPGRDAAILYDKIDLKFKNNLPYPVKIKGEMTNNRLVVRFCGSMKSDFKTFVDVEVIQVYPAPDMPPYPKDDNGKSPIPSNGKNGVKVKVFRTTQKESGHEKREVVSIDTYKPVPGGTYVND
ncbi:MAG: VanW family protein [Candidatus Eremiobacteraeota bacterium]|nr:VanW family protein [Candidatus Eremiobacteraeota bacterium]